MLSRSEGSIKGFSLQSELCSVPKTISRNSSSDAKVKTKS